MQGLLRTPLAKLLVGLLIGAGLLVLVSRFANIPATLHVLQQNLLTPRGITLACLSGVAFLLAFAIWGMRWKLFLNPIGKVSTFTAVRLALVSTFINFLLPINGGEIAKALTLKRIAGIPISRSLPTIALDRAMDLLPALVLMASVPLLGIQMDLELWFILGAVSGLLIGLCCFMALAVWKRAAAITLLRSITGRLPKRYGGTLEAFGASFVDALIIGARRPRVFIPAALLTCAALFFDSLFAMLAFWVIGFPLPLGEAIFGYTLYNMVYIFPTPPGQIGSNEAVGLLVFGGLLHLPSNKVLAMFLFSHPWAALLMCLAGLICLKSLGLTVSTAIRAQPAKCEETSLEHSKPIKISN